MDIDLNQLSPNAVYFNMIQTLVPRPIAWVMSQNANGSFNLAPFSYFNAISSNPPLVMVSVGKKPDGSDKDTRSNVAQRNHFVIHIPHRGMLTEMNESSATLPAEVSELEHLGLETVPMEGSPVPRVKGARIAYACERHEILEVGNTPQSLIIGRVNRIYIDDGVMGEDAKGRPKVDVAKLDPVARLGASEYMACGEIITLNRPD